MIINKFTGMQFATVSAGSKYARPSIALRSHSRLSR